MAGNYPDIPSYRIPYEKDGTIFLAVSSGGVITELTNADLVIMNDEDDDAFYYTSLGPPNYAVWMFPRKMDIDGYFFGPSLGAGRAGAISVSADTTNGYDGTWTQIVADAVDAAATRPYYRTAIQSTTALGVRAIRVQVTGSFGDSYWRPTAVHWFGEPSAGENTDYLRLWHPTLNQQISPAYFDWGNVPRGSSADITFRVKNLSPTLTAQSPRVAMDAPSDGSPSVPGWHTLSKDGVTFLAQQTLGNLAPGAISTETLTLRRTTPSNAQLGLWTMRVFAESTVWV